MAVALLVGCGNEGNEPGADPDPFDETPCDDCYHAPPPNELTPAWVATPSVFVTPHQLMFYGDLSASEALPPRALEIVNDTQASATIESLEIIDDEDSPAGEGASEFFTLTGFARPIKLLPGQRLVVHVRFEVTMEQREALLIIETTAPGNEELVVPLAGKYFYIGGS